MLSMRIDDPNGVKRQFEALPDRLENVRKAMGHHISRAIRDDVRSRLPGREGWLGIYRDAIEFFYDGKEWAVAGEKNIPDMKDLNAEITLLSFGQSDKASSILFEYNPWPLDLIPAVDRTYGPVLVKATTQAEVSQRRTSLLRSLPIIKQRLTNAGYAIEQYGLPKFGGRIIADLSFMAYRLEHGIAPLPAAPHWRPAVQNVGRLILDKFSEAKQQAAAILKGRMPTLPKPMSSELKTLIATSSRRQVAKLSS